MSVIFGMRHRSDQTVQEGQLLDLAHATDRYALDGTFVRARGHMGMGFQPYHTHERSNLESQPTVDAQGNMVTLDGRIDNHKELCEVLGLDGSDSPDSTIVLAAFRRWGEECFGRLIGDWALALWFRSDRLLYLARDHAGMRTLYFEEKDGSLRWSTFLETFFVPGTPRPLDESYVVSYLTCRPVCDRTPYRNILAVAPAHYWVFGERVKAQRAHWTPAVTDRITHRTDRQYEEHFISLFKQAVDRRTGPGAPILAHLSGGLDSTSIVCMCDEMRRAQSTAPPTLIDTLSFYDDSEPSWNEKPYFSIVELKRGQTGIHIESSFADWTFDPANAEDEAYLVPGADSGTPLRENKIYGHLRSGAYRAIVAGTGGDELLGGVPTPLPILADYIVSIRLIRLLRDAVEWCLVGRKPLTMMLREALMFTIHMYQGNDDETETSCPWVRLPLPENRDGKKILPWRVRPSSISKSRGWRKTVATLPHLFPTAIHRYEYRYPYLDRDLVEFLFCLPPEQLVRPGQRRSLMRRALKGIVPKEILERRRKAFLARGPLTLLQNSEDRIRSLFANSLMEQFGFVDSAQLIAALASINRGETSINRTALMRTIGFELWMQASNNRIAPSLA
jgi:asparagine synthase (glutamine-hydrolysing)